MWHFWITSEKKYSIFLPRANRTIVKCKLMKLKINWNFWGTIFILRGAWQANVSFSSVEKYEKRFFPPEEFCLRFAWDLYNYNGLIRTSKMFYFSRYNEILVSQRNQINEKMVILNQPPYINSTISFVIFCVIVFCMLICRKAYSKLNYCVRYVQQDVYFCKKSKPAIMFHKTIRNNNERLWSFLTIPV